MVSLSVEEVMMFSITNRNKVILVVLMPYFALNVFLVMAVHITDLDGNAQVVEILIYIELEV
jgi:hypothetical protein